MKTKKPDWREVFSIDAMRARFKVLGHSPTRGEYSDRERSCLIGSFEHTCAVNEGHSNVAKNLYIDTRLTSIGGIAGRTLRMLEQGWEDLDSIAERPGAAPRTREEAEMVEHGRALGILFVGPREGDYAFDGDVEPIEIDILPTWEERLDARLKRAGIK